MGKFLCLTKTALSSAFPVHISAYRWTILSPKRRKRSRKIFLCRFISESRTARCYFRVIKL